MVLASLDLKVTTVFPGGPAVLVAQVPKETRETPAFLDPLDPPPICRSRRGRRETADPQVSAVSRVRRVLLVSLETLVYRDWTDGLEHLDHQVLKETRVFPEVPVPRARQEPKAAWGRWASRGTAGPRGPPASPDARVSPEGQGPLGSLEPRETPEYQE